MFEVIIEVIIEGKSHFFNWIDDDENEYIENDNGLFISYDKTECESSFDVDEALEELSNDTVDESSILNIINLMTDFGFNTKKLFPNEVYDKLFWGNNLPSVTPEGKHYTPKWSKNEIAFLENGIKKFFDILPKIKRHNESI